MPACIQCFLFESLYTVSGCHGRVPQPGSRHRGLLQTMEEVCRERMSREREIPAGMEEQVVASEALHDEGAAT